MFFGGNNRTEHAGVADLLVHLQRADLDPFLLGLGDTLGEDLQFLGGFARGFAVNEAIEPVAFPRNADAQVKVFAVLVGREQGAGGNMRDRFGRQEHATNPTLLKRIAADTGGKYFNAGDDAALERGFEEVRATLDKSKRKEVGRIYTDLYPRFAALGFALILLELLLSFTWFRRFP